MAKKKTSTSKIPSKQRSASKKKTGSKKKASKRSTAAIKTGEAAEEQPDPPEDLQPAKVTAENLSALAELQKKANEGDKKALEALSEVIMNFGQWRQAKDRNQQVARQCKERLEQEEAALKDAIESPIPIGSTQETFDASREKLEQIEKSWQEVQEVKAANEEEKKEAKKALKMWGDKLDRSIQNSAQLTLGF